MMDWIMNKKHHSPKIRLKPPSLSKSESQLSVEDDDDDNIAHNSSWKTSSINLVKNAVGSGVFSLNSRVSAISDSPIIFVHVSTVIIAMALWATYNFYILGEVCRLTDSQSYGEAWAASVGKNTQWIVQTILLLAPLVGCLANTIVLSDILTLVLQSFGVSAWYCLNRYYIVFTVVACILYPISVIKDLSALKSVSMVGLVGQFSAMLVLLVRLLDGTYREGGEFFASSSAGRSAAAAHFSSSTASAHVTHFHRYHQGHAHFHQGQVHAIASTSLASDTTPTAAKWLLLISLLSYCFVTHYNAPKYYTELIGKERDPRIFFNMTLVGYLSSAGIYILTVVVAALLFGRASASFALNSFSPHDPLAIVALLAFALSSLTAFPLVFMNVRNWFTTQAEVRFPPLGNVHAMSAVLLTFLGILACIFNDIGKVGSLAGAIFGSCMMFIFPSIMYIRVLYKQAAKSKEDVHFMKLMVNYALLTGGVSIGIFGTINSLLAFMK